MDIFVGFYRSMEVATLSNADHFGVIITLWNLYPNPNNDILNYQ
ncbi:MAG: hypothetical protein WCT40_04405 [Candidatus Magasanikbacteria bacterium]|jgi:hypothetical protein